MTEPFELDIDAQGRLNLRRPGQADLADVRLRRAFPWSNPGKFISIRAGDGREVLQIEDVDDLAPSTAKLVRDWLDSVSFIPRIQKIARVDTRFGYQNWSVQTDRGDVEFRVMEREDIRFMPDGRFCVKDADGNLYEMPPLTQLDAGSRKAIEALL